jgi:N utilization substance protein B
MSFEMKTAQDPRHQRRIDYMQKLFTFSFGTKPDPDIQVVYDNLSTIDPQIQLAAPEWSLDKIAKIDLAILRLAVFELTIEKKEPEKVIIDEAVELAKSYGNSTSAGFINGVLGTIVKHINEQPTSV